MLIDVSIFQLEIELRFISSFFFLLGVKCMRIPRLKLSSFGRSVICHIFFSLNVDRNPRIHKICKYKGDKCNQIQLLITFFLFVIESKSDDEVHIFKSLPQIDTNKACC